MAEIDDAPVLQVRGLKTHFFTDQGRVPAVDGIDLEIAQGRTLGLVGESGCGKSVTGLSIMRLIARPGKIVAGEVLLRGENLLKLPEREMRVRRGGEIGMIFQEPMTSLDPLFPISDPIVEALRAHRRVTSREALKQATALLADVGIPDPERRIRSYPHELSGGMRQRVMIAVALSCRPAVLIADEPTTALDVTVQAQILALQRELQREHGTAILLITHNLGLVAENCDTVAVMYAGKVVERAPKRSLFRGPRHPYTQGLLRAVPRLDHPPKQPLVTIPGIVPNPLRLPAGCRFRARCPWAIGKCAEEEPPLMAVGEAHASACWVQPEFAAAPPTVAGAKGAAA
ncbi:MAG TPA: ABC transporter ATP-binding protein [Chthonomonadaceae bacterium]|nr:ABC transporter ATP-binding protein [Chthonomonadaceae bacterium]